MDEIFDVNEVFDSYKENEELDEVDIIHLYDTGDTCITDNKGYCDSRFFRLIGFNTDKLEKRDYGIRDGILSSSNNNSNIDMIRVFYDGSFLIRFFSKQKISGTQCAELIISEKR